MSDIEKLRDENAALRAALDLQMRRDAERIEQSVADMIWDTTGELLADLNAKLDRYREALEKIRDRDLSAIAPLPLCWCCKATKAGRQRDEIDHDPDYPCGIAQAALAETESAPGKEE